MNRRVREPYARWCERCTGGVTPSAIYSIVESYLLIFISNVFLPTVYAYDDDGIY